MDQARKHPMHDKNNTNNSKNNSSDNIDSNIKRGQDVVLLKGYTGTGKSTTIHFLGDSKMQRDPNTCHIELIDILNPCLREIRIGREFKVAQCVTTYIGVPMKLSHAGVRLMGNNKLDLVFLCDSLGYDDSVGPPIDVANGLGVVKGVCEAKSVKIILVFVIGDFASLTTTPNNNNNIIIIQRKKICFVHNLINKHKSENDTYNEDLLGDNNEDA